MQELRPGQLWYHYKNPDKPYRIEWIGRLQTRGMEDLEECVIYRALHDSEEFGNQALWVRPKDMFLETIEIDGKTIPRFILAQDHP